MVIDDFHRALVILIDRYRCTKQLFVLESSTIRWLFLYNLYTIPNNTGELCLRELKEQSVNRRYFICKKKLLWYILIQLVGVANIAFTIDRETESVMYYKRPLGRHVLWICRETNAEQKGILKGWQKWTASRQNICINMSNENMKNLNHRSHRRPEFSVCCSSLFARCLKKTKTRNRNKIVIVVWSSVSFWDWCPVFCHPIVVWLRCIFVIFFRHFTFPYSCIFSRASA